MDRSLGATRMEVHPVLQVESNVLFIRIVAPPLTYRTASPSVRPLVLVSVFLPEPISMGAQPPGSIVRGLTS
jgi:hypothetical protein